jgi:hypothetical protein
LNLELGRVVGDVFGGGVLFEKLGSVAIEVQMHRMSEVPNE